MHFLIADTFTDSLARLTGEQQKIVKTTAFDLQLNPAGPGLSFHRVERGKDKNFWSVRVGTDIRLIVHKTEASILLCYVDHHDKAYDWAACRKLETHPRTGAAQLVEVRESVQQILIPRYVAEDRATPAKPALFSNLGDEELLSYGVPAELFSEVRKVDEDTLLDLADHLPSEAAEALLDLATGGKPRVVQPPAEVGPFAHPDAQRRFRTVKDVEELARALEYPWDKWTVFLHPTQRQVIEREYNGPARVSGSAGTGKTIVALHRAVYLARAHSDARVLLTTFSNPLAHALRTRLRRLIGNEPHLAERLDVYSIGAFGERLHRALLGKVSLASREHISAALREASAAVGGHKFGQAFLLSEWEQVVDAWQLAEWGAYRDVVRLGRKTRLSESQRTVLWSIFERVQAHLSERGLITPSGMFTRLAAAVSHSNKAPYDYVIADEAQDIAIAHLRFFAALAAGRANALFFAGDLGQRIFQQPFSWLALGVDIRGRSRTLRVNYRTSHQIRSQADRLLGAELRDADGNVEERAHTVSVFNGPPPVVDVLGKQDEEMSQVAKWIGDRVKEGLVAHELGVFVRSAAELQRAVAAVREAGVPFKILDEKVETVSRYACIGTMHLAKGLEFRAVVVMACDDEIIPSQQRIETVGDEADLREVYDTERHLLYVACTRARDHLLVTGVAPASEFLDDLRGL